MRSRLLVFVLVALTSALACAPGNATFRAPGTASYLRSVPSTDLYMFTEARFNPVESLYDVLRRTHPRFLVSRDVSLYPPQFGEEVIGVYINGVFNGGLDVLQSIPAGHVLSVERVKPADAANRYAKRHRGHVLDVTLLRH